MRNQPNALLHTGILCLFIFGIFLVVDLYEAFYGNADIWWTPKDRMLNFGQTKNHFEIWVSGRPMASLMDQGRLLAVDGRGNQFRVAAGDVGVRLNNWPARQLTLLKCCVYYALFTGVGLALTALGVAQRLRDRKTKKGEDLPASP